MTTEELAREARAAVAAGAFAVHVHPRDGEGKESLAAADVARAVAAIRGACPDVAVGVTTGAWIVPDPGERLARVRGWSALPDFASVNFHEEGAAGLARLLLDRDVGFEAGVTGLAAVDALLSSDLAGLAVRLLLEPAEEDLAGALAGLAAMEEALSRSDVRTPRLLHGAGAPVWPLVRIAAGRGYDTRVGLEDTLVLPDGRAAPDNGALVAEAMRIVCL